MRAIGRAFLAVVPPPEALDAIARRVQGLAAGTGAWRWMGRDRWHVTLRFLGSVDDADAVVAAVRGAVGASGTFDVTLDGAGAFPARRRASTLWLAVGAGADRLAALEARLSAALAPLGWAAEERPFRAHLTVARRTRPTDARALVEALEGSGPRWTVEAVALMESRTDSDGATYAEVGRVGLG